MLLSYLQQRRPLKPVYVLVMLCSIAAIYCIAGKLGLKLAVFHQSATPVWPPTGISLAAFLLFGYWVWPSIFLGAFAVNMTTAGSLASSLGIATGNTFEGLLGAFLINYFANGSDVFTRQQDTLKFVLLAALLSTTVSPTLGVTSLCLTGYADWESYRAIWITWWLGDAGGALIVTPAIILWASECSVKWSQRFTLEMGISLMVLCVITVMVFHSDQAMTGPNYPLGFLMLSILIWIAVRLGSRATVTAILLCVGIAIWGTLRGFGPFARGGPNESLLMLQAFVAVIAVTALALTVGVSEQKRGEQALDQLNQTLEQRVQDSTSSLQVAVEQLQELDRLKNAFVTIVSHELRTPLTSIKGLVENMLQEMTGPLNDKQTHYLSRIQLNAERLTRMLNVLLDLSKIEAGKMELLRRPMPLHEIFADLLEGFRPLAQLKSISMEVTPAEGIPTVQADREKLYEVLANLLDNAIKFTPPGGRVRIGAQILDARYIKVGVSDTGCGIAEEHLVRIFDKFYRVPSSSAQATGAGLGLTITRGLVELHGGTIAVESVPGQGSHFYFTVPYT
ncbi:MAG: MASE1 domain-containing protein [Nitrospiraceae bacterium]